MLCVVPVVYSVFNVATRLEFRAARKPQGASARPPSKACIARLMPQKAQGTSEQRLCNISCAMLFLLNRLKGRASAQGSDFVSPKAAEGGNPKSSHKTTVGNRPGPARSCGRAALCFHGSQSQARGAAAAPRHRGEPQGVVRRALL